MCDIEFSTWGPTYKTKYRNKTHAKIFDQLINFKKFGSVIKKEWTARYKHAERGS